MLVVGVAVMLVWLQWESANKVATAVSALAGLAAVGVAVWAGWPAAARSPSTGRPSTSAEPPTATGSAPSPEPSVRDVARHEPGRGRREVSADGGRVRVRKTGAATASGAGDANTGVVGKSGAVPGDLVVDGSGDAKASGEGDANSGIRLS